MHQKIIFSITNCVFWFYNDHLRHRGTIKTVCRHHRYTRDMPAHRVGLGCNDNIETTTGVTVGEHQTKYILEVCHGIEVCKGILLEIDELFIYVVKQCNYIPPDTCNRPVK